MGLVETGVGLVPAAGGIKESLLRAMAAHAGEAICSSPSCASRSRPSRRPRRRAPRWDAADMGYLRGGDGVTMNRESVIYAAKQVALALADAG